MTHARRGRLLWGWGGLALFGFAIAQACTSHVPEYALVDGGDEGGENDGADAADAAPGRDATTDASDAETDVAPVPLTYIRFAEWSPDAPGVDFCVAPRTGAPSDAATGREGGEMGVDAGEDWQGPLIAEAATLVDGGITIVFEAGVPSGIDFPGTSSYFALPAGGYDVRPVAAGSSDCSLPLLGNDATDLPTFQAGARSTVALLGDYNQAATDPLIRIVAFADDASSAAGDIAVRFVTAVPSVSALGLGLGTLGSPGFRPLFSGVAFGKADDAKDSDAGKVDPQGYLTLARLANAVLTVTSVSGMDAGGPLIVAGGVTIPAGSVATLVAVGGKTGGAAPAPELALCLDNAPAVEFVFGNCTVLAPPGD